MKTGAKEMENQQKVINMMMMFERMLQEQQEMLEITMVVQELAQRNGQFNGKDVSRYLWDYKAEMLRCGISERLQVRSFNRVGTDGLQESIHETRQQTRCGGPSKKPYGRHMTTRYRRDNFNASLTSGWHP